MRAASTYYARGRRSLGSAVRLLKIADREIEFVRQRMEYWRQRARSVEGQMKEKNSGT